MSRLFSPPTPYGLTFRNRSWVAPVTFIPTGAARRDILVGDIDRAPISLSNCEGGRPHV